MRILALDLATRSGWACGDAGETPQHGTFTLPSTGDDVGRFLFEFMRWLKGLIATHEPREIVFEAPILPRETNIATLRKLYSLAGVTEVMALDAGIPCSEISAGEVRRAFLGQHYPRKAQRDEIKRAVIAGCRMHGWNPRDDNDADALATLHVALCARNPRFSAESLVRSMETA